MSATTALFRNELRLTLRTPAIVIWTVVIPVVAIIVMCSIPGARQPLEAFGGLSVVEAYQPTLVVFAASMLALQMMPMILGQYRELGFLRRLRTTPAHPGNLLAAVLALILVIILVVGLFLSTLPLFFGLGSVGRQTLVVLLLIPCAAAFLAVGALLAAVIPNPRVASGVGSATAAVMWFAAGMWVPRAVFPGWLATVADWTPGGAVASLLTSAATGAAIGWQPLVCLVAWTVIGFTVAIRTFRWE
ncbi:ABC-2 type transport system permease protein [Raineyella antarctica]|uniref:ABC-2 type transport system permease protein n=1 Tax=Raineyella antarctica TaxID=1577474 RepID=A0A1G6GCY2_9ACTN|nr:ABC transporter permease [Raineyella antarctica]SDB79769.1 ABC-2 type transport system permease protein [Raineyella antarctica]